jgi:serine protease Do
MRRGLIAATAALVLLVTACGGDGGNAGGDDTTDTTERARRTTTEPDDTSPTTARVASTTASTAPSETTTRSGPVAGEPVGTLADVESATLQIVGTGVYRDPEIGTVDAFAGAGSGFFVTPSGLALTAYHVVAGAEELAVYISGDTTAHTASVVASSECNDVALIQVDGLSDVVPYLSFFEGTVAGGLDVHAAGYLLPTTPGERTEYVVADGIVADPSTDDQTLASFVPYNLKVDAPIEPGATGGPLVTDDALVVGINHANLSDDRDRQLVTPLEHALPVIDGTTGYLDGFGISGSVVDDPSSGVLGIWVTTVDPGSPAAATGVQPGDVVMRIGDNLVGGDGTLSAYCEVLQSTKSGDVVDVQVYRLDTGETLAGTINGAPLTPSFTFVGDVSSALDGLLPEAPRYSGFETITDDTGVFTVDIPVEWTDVNGGAITFGDGETPGITAAADRAAFVETFDESGIQMLYIDGSFGDPATILFEQFDFTADCTSQGFLAYEDVLFVGSYELWTSCGPNSTALLVIVGQPPDTLLQPVALVFQMTTTADLVALQRIFDSYSYV